MRLWILSDLHIESCRWELPDPRPEYDVLIAAGDIFTPASSGVDWLSRRARGKPVIYVQGNHEWYSPNHLNWSPGAWKTIRVRRSAEKPSLVRELHG